MTLQEIAELFDKFFYSPVDTRPLALFRIAFGICILIDNAISAVKKVHLFSADGFLPKSITHRRISKLRLSIFNFFGNKEGYVRAVLIAGSLAGFCIAIGLATPVMAFFVFVLQASKRNRNPYNVYSGESVAKFMALFLTFAPGSSHWSVDSQLGWFSSWGSTAVINLMRIQLCIIYLRSIYWKSRAPTWARGDAVFTTVYFSQAGYSSRLFYPILSLKIVNKIATWSTLVVQSTVPFFFWFKETQLIAICACWILHLSLQSMMSVGLFQLYMIAATLLFFPF